jgi:hypothetical protein
MLSPDNNTQQSDNRKSIENTTINDLETTNIKNTELSTFLKELATSIDNHSIAKHKLQHIGEFYMSHKLLENINDGNDGNNDFDPSDVIKFITLGWYMYKVILETGNENMPNSSL